MNTFHYPVRAVGNCFDPGEIVKRIEEVDDDAIRRVVARWRSGPPTLVALGPVSRLEEFDRTRMGIPLEDVEAWAKSLGTESELPPSKPRKLS